MKQKLILLTLVIGLTIVSQSTLSLGMGNIQVYSSLDEQLRSTIELITSPDEDLQNLTVKLASSADYKKVGLDKSFVPSSILVRLDEDNPNRVNVTSNGPISEPIISLLLDVNWNNGRILREFTILLDPPTYDVPSSHVQVNNVVVDPIQEKVIEEPVLQQREEGGDQAQTTFTNEDVAKYDQSSTESDAQTTAESVDAVSSYEPNGDVFVNEGDTLWSIANSNKLGGLSTNQMMMAIYNNNSAAFIDNNINKLIKGSQLNMPTIDQAEAISYAEALAQVESHHQSWAPEQQDYSSYQTTDDSYTDSSDTSSSLDYGVQLSGGDSDGSDSGQTNAEVGDSEVDQLSAEEQYNQESESVELQERISELEEIVEQQQSVLEIGDDSLANLESQLDEAAENTDAAINQAVDAADDVWDEAVDQVSDNIDEATVDPSNDLTLDIASVDTSELNDADTDATDESNLVSSDDSLDVEESAVDTVDEKPAKVSPPKFSVPVKQEPSMVDKTINWVMDNLKWVLIGLGGLVLLLIVPRFLRGGGGDEDETSFLDDIKQRKSDATEEAEELLEEAHESVDTKINQPLDTEESVEDFADEMDDAEDVLAELDKSIVFDENESDDSEEDIFSTEELASSDNDDFDLDGFLNDSDMDTSVTKDHSKTLAEGGFSEESADDLDHSDDAFEDVSFDDLGMDLDDKINAVVDEAEVASEDVVSDVSDEIEETLDLSDDLELDLDLDDELADLTTDDNNTSDQNKDAESEDEAFSFDEDFDFELDDELEEAEETVAADDTDSSDEFDDLLDLSDDAATETFDTNTSDNMDEEIDLGLEDLMDDGDAIDTKLDLAKAYLEMGDVEGAKNLLDEVVSEGSDSQVDEAKKIIDDM